MSSQQSMQTHSANDASTHRRQGLHAPASPTLCSVHGIRLATRPDPNRTRSSTETLMKKMRFALALALLGLCRLPVQPTQPRPTKWDLPAPTRRPTSTPRTSTQFAADVDRATGGKLKITVHANASLFKAPEIKRAVQGGQAQLGEILLVNFANEDPIYGSRRRALPRRQLRRKR
jgi:hypothetical protein